MKKRSFKKPVKPFEKELPKSILALGGAAYSTSLRMGIGMRKIYLCPMTPYHVAAIRASKRRL